MALIKALPCVSARRWFSILASAIIEKVDESVTTFGDFSWQKSESAHLESLQKKRRMDFHVKLYATTVGVLAGEQSSCSIVARSMHEVDPSQSRRWNYQETNAFRAACHMRFCSSSTISVCADATRVSRPAKDILLVVVSDVWQRASRSFATSGLD